MPRALLVNTEPNTMDRWIIKHDDGELYAASIYYNQLHNASNLTERELEHLQREVNNTRYEIEIYMGDE